MSTSVYVALWSIFISACFFLGGYQIGFNSHPGYNQMTEMYERSMNSTDRLIETLKQFQERHKS